MVTITCSFVDFVERLKLAMIFFAVQLCQAQPQSQYTDSTYQPSKEVQDSISIPRYYNIYKTLDII